MISDGGALAGSWRRKRRHDECRSPSTETATERAPSERASEAPALAGQAVLRHLPSPPQRADASCYLSQFCLEYSKKERFGEFVKKEPRVSRRYGCRFFSPNLEYSLIFLTFLIFFRLRKEKIKWAKKRNRNFFPKQSPADGWGDFDVFRTIRLSGSQSAPQPLVVAKKQPVEKKPHPPKFILTETVRKCSMAVL